MVTAPDKYSGVFWLWLRLLIFSAASLISPLGLDG